ncbi:hypothetical protein N7465_009311 [Penicillium sp. CMV-2018d]|nr:hypothetical protein N7465_009311 [Penicillium sp. CMV-2018d]
MEVLPRAEMQLGRCRVPIGWVGKNDTYGHPYTGWLLLRTYFLNRRRDLATLAPLWRITIHDVAPGQ